MTTQPPMPDKTDEMMELMPFSAGQKVVIELTDTNAKTLNEEQRMIAGRCFPDGDYIVPLEIAVPAELTALLAQVKEALEKIQNDTFYFMTRNNIKDRQAELQLGRNKEIATQALDALKPWMKQ